MRIVDEWKDYDTEIKRLQLEVDEHVVEETIQPSIDKQHADHTELCDIK